MINRLVISGFLQFKSLDMPLDSELSIFVGNNDTGKSTTLVAIEMALNGRFRGRPLDSELSPHWFHHDDVAAYGSELAETGKAAPPVITIEVFFEDKPELVALKGKNNSLGADTPGVRLEICLDPAYQAEYDAYVEASTFVSSVPVEFYQIRRHDFSGESLAGRRPPVRAILIDAATLQFQAGMDYYLRRSIREHLAPEARAKLSLAYREHRDEMIADAAFTEANQALDSGETTLSDRKLSLATDVSARSSWESGISPHLDDIPFDLVGQGEQSAFKVLLALNRSAQEHHVVMVEEPENHLSHSKLNILLARIKKKLTDQQLLVSTHSSFVLNKLGIDNLRLMTGHIPHFVKLDALTDDTQKYFLKLPGFDTLRLLLADKVILVEGPSDELLVQRAYADRHDGHMPIEGGIDVMSVGLTFKRFLELGKLTNRKIAVITDLDSDSTQEIARQRFAAFEVAGQIKGFIGEVSGGRTLENQVVHSAGRASLNAILGTDFTADDELVEHMKSSKTDAALKIFETADTVELPEHIYDAISFLE